MRVFVMLVSLLCGSMWGAARNSPPWPDPVLPPSAKTAALPEAPHDFLDARNKISLGALAGLLAADGVTTQQNLANHAHELNPIARPLVEHGWAGQLGASVLGYSASIGLSYMVHRSGHHKLERVILHAAMAGEAAMVMNNLARARAH
jgi:hypothetical protein